MLLLCGWFGRLLSDNEGQQVVSVSYLKYGAKGKSLVGGKTKIAKSAVQWQHEMQE